MPLLPNLPEDTYFVNETPLVNTDENIYEILAGKFEESDVKV
jgi:hypothetical protein